MTVQGFVFHSAGYKLLGRLWLAAGDTPRPTALLLHGIPGIEQSHDVALALRDLGWNSLIFHYRGGWGSEGSYHLPTIPDDVQAAVDALCEHPAVDASQIVAIGHSLGGWAAVMTAVRDDRIKAVGSIAAVTDPASWLMTAEKAVNFTPWLTGITPEELADQWQTIAKNMRPVRVVHKLAPRPLLVVHGSADTAVPPTHSNALVQRAKEPITYHTIPHADHGFSAHRPQLIELVVQWLTKSCNF